MQTFVLLSSTTISLAIGLFVFFGVAYRDGAVFAQLQGKQETCNTGDTFVNSTDAPNMKCFDCTCKNGVVECIKQKCPDIEGCYRLQILQADECCQKCKGCMKNNVYHESGTDWIESSDPCRIFTCTAGVVTESQIRCYTPCQYPRPSLPGQCCPTCTGCRFKGQKIVEQTRIIPKEDPCVTCNCSSGKLTCTKKACPVLNCPESKIVQGFEECCPQCIGTGKRLDPPKGGCILGMKLYRSGMSFDPDSCTHCTCTNSTIHCQRESCPILDCKQNQQKLLPGRCCAQCGDMELIVSDEYKVEKIDKGSEMEEDYNEEDEIEEDFIDKDEIKEYDASRFEIEPQTTKIAITNIKKDCLHNGQAYSNEETWNTGLCEICTCKNGRVNCKAVTCSAVPCPPNSILKVPEGQCCPVCEEKQGVCTVIGGSHFRTFDSKIYAFVGSCKYQLASDCDSGMFNVRLKNTVIGNDVAIKKISLRLGKVKVDLQQNRNTKVNDQIIELPYQFKDKLTINETNDNVIVSSKIGVKVLWNYVGFLELTLPKNYYRKKVCGLCGNFNSLPNDDFTTREGILVEDPAIFAQSWTADEFCFETRKYGYRGCHPRKDQRLCSYIKGSVFDKCLKKINVTSYYERCLKDMCECSVDDFQCHCESFSSYVYDCEKLGILLPSWRKSVGC